MPTFVGIAMRMYNAAHRFVKQPYLPVSDSPELNEIYARSQAVRNDICDHLATIFSEATALQPRLIVELGVRDGTSRFALERVAGVTGATLVSVDMEDCSPSCKTAPKWHFVQGDDIQFAARFTTWCVARSITPSVDVLFVDTSHLYEHTVQEINSWFPLLSHKCKAIFHDTNIRPFYRRLDGTVGRGWDNKRGVIQAVEEYLGTKFNEKIDFVTTVEDWIVRHWSHCNGLTVLERVPKPSN